MNLDWNKIKEKYPKVYLAFQKYRYGTLKHIVYNIPKKQYIKFETECCYCDIEKFFQENNIIITINYHDYDKNFYYIIYFKTSSFQAGHDIDINKVKEEAIYKAFKFLEVKLLEENS